MNDERFSVAAYAVVENGRGEVLLTRRRESDDWVLPGGSLESEEAPWEAVRREVGEETGLQIAEHDDGAVVFERLAPAVGDRLQDRQRRRSRGWVLQVFDRVADSFDAEA